MSDYPFYHNYVFRKEDLERSIIRWWEYPLLWFLPTYVQVNEGYAWFYKTWRGRIYLVGEERLGQEHWIPLSGGVFFKMRLLRFITNPGGLIWAIYICTCVSLTIYFFTLKPRAVRTRYWVCTKEEAEFDAKLLKESWLGRWRHDWGGREAVDPDPVTLKKYIERCEREEKDRLRGNMAVEYLSKKGIDWENENP